MKRNEPGSSASLQHEKNVVPYFYPSCRENMEAPSILEQSMGLFAQQK
jgi:hypothetical protein